ncbi:chemotaxis protein CheW [Marinimicrobium agarilyticum]|uniref:chemotaxis protein CheW n=1 Tax=Marinimicrobium agarilyticum TaxID=306546 RepID=UPI0004241AAF|nr:chemotaxis protein CheW [Marinimicrobium agarilyticum]
MSRSRKDHPQALLQAYMDELLTGPESSSTGPAYADPQDEQRERLQKLLYSATQKQTVAQRISEPVVVEPKAHPGVATKIEARPIAPPKPPAPQVKIVEPSPAPEVAQPVQVPEVEDLPEPAPEPAAMAFRMKDVEWLENGRPAWAQQRFDVLLFKVSGLTLAVPLVALGQIQPLTDELTPLFGQADWFMGLLPTPGGKIRTVNTAKFVMPERYDERFVETAQYVISIDGVPWGLAVDSVNQPITLDPEDVKWRSERSRRPWLAGTVKEHMCALLDIPRVGQLLMEADRKRA